MGYAAVISLLIAGMQVLVEGYRWQMILAYALSGLLFLVWLRQTIVPAGTALGGGLDNRLAAGLAIGLGVLGLALSIVLPIVLPVFRFPPPTGPFAIGTLTYHWVDADRPEVFSADPHDQRELMAQIWYPAKKDPSAPRAPWVQDADAVAPALARLLFHLPEFSFGDFKYVTSNAMASAAMADEEPSYPVLIFLHGFLGFRQQKTFQVEELVSHGYIVVGIDQPYAAADVVFPLGRQVEGWGGRLVPLVGPSIISVETAPVLNGRAFADGLVPYFAQDVSFTLDQLAALNRADPLTASPMFTPAPPGQTGIRASAKVPANEVVTIIWRVDQERAEQAPEKLLDLQPGKHIVAFTAVRRLKGRICSQQRFVPGRVLELEGVRISTNRVFNLNGAETTGSGANAPANALTEHLFPLVPNSNQRLALSPTDRWTLELSPDDNPFLRSVTSNDNVQVDLDEVEDAILILEYETGIS